MPKMVQAHAMRLASIVDAALFDLSKAKVRNGCAKRCQRLGILLPITIDIHASNERAEPRD